MVLTRTHGIDNDLWYRQRLMVLETPMVLTKIHGIKSVILNHTRMRGPSVTRMQDFFKYLGFQQNWLDILLTFLFCGSFSLICLTLFSIGFKLKYKINVFYYHLMEACIYYG